MKSRDNMHIYELDFIRVFMTLCILAFHWHCHFNNFFDLSFIGAATNVIYFYISGYLLFIKYHNNIYSLKDVLMFYKKRYLRIMPKYYVIWILSFAICCLFGINLFDNTKPIAILFTLFGLDGYLSVRYSTFYLIGDWFIGMIIILYILFPLILYFFKKNKYLFISIICVCFFIFKIKKFPCFALSFMSIIECLWYFCLGFVFAKLGNKIKNKTLFFVSIVYIFLFNNYRNMLIIDQFFYISLFIVLFNIGSFIFSFNDGKTKSVYKMLSSSCLTFLLLHHLPIRLLSEVYQPPSLWESCFVFIIYLLLLIIITYLFDSIYDFFVEKIKKKRKTCN